MYLVKANYLRSQPHWFTLSQGALRQEVLDVLHQEPEVQEVDLFQVDPFQVGLLLKVEVHQLEDALVLQWDHQELEVGLLVEDLCLGALVLQ